MLTGFPVVLDLWGVPHVPMVVDPLSFMVWFLELGQFPKLISSNSVEAYGLEIELRKCGYQRKY